ncbi:hypothetical protein K466DRAFT_568382 [Polyporus arcularius HHB13444]|uniref:Uncharacterized protein n=1 Tax=Polyporus arcularius HHB13444 TaxID=1314778 RepID=A0A5C3P118_9APHY|nr:hypothetical protein K466DRAFT_568382 [Polyporus arcularius HHB13444]
MHQESTGLQDPRCLRSRPELIARSPSADETPPHGKTRSRHARHPESRRTTSPRTRAKRAHRRSDPSTSRNRVEHAISIASSTLGHPQPLSGLVPAPHRGDVEAPALDNTDEPDSRRLGGGDRGSEHATPGLGSVDAATASEYSTNHGLETRAKYTREDAVSRGVAPWSSSVHAEADESRSVQAVAAMLAHASRMYEDSGAGLQTWTRASALGIGATRVGLAAATWSYAVEFKL